MGEKLLKEAMQEVQNMELIVLEEQNEMTHASQTIYGEAKGFVIRTPEMKAKSSELLQKVKGKLADYEIIEKACKKPFKDKIDIITALFKNPLTVLKQAEAILKNAILDWNDKLEADRKAKEEELKKQQAAEAKKLEAKAAKTKDPEKKAELQATAEAIKSVVPVVATAAVKVDGEVTVKNWDFEVIDPLKVPIEYQMPDEVKIRKVVKATEGSLQIPGIRIYSYNSLRSSKTKGY